MRARAIVCRSALALLTGDDPFIKRCLRCISARVLENGFSLADRSSLLSLMMSAPFTSGATGLFMDQPPSADEVEAVIIVFEYGVT